MSFWTKIRNAPHAIELVRAIPLLGIAGLILIPDNGSMVVLYALGITLLVTACSHIIRKVLFPYIDMQVFAEKSLESPTAAAIVFSAVSFLLAVIILATCFLLH